MRISRVRGMVVALLLLALVASVAPVWAADIGQQMEREYGVVGRDSDEGARLNSELDRVVQRVTDAIGFRVKSHRLLGGRSAKRDKVINAFALPDGRIYVTLGLMRAAHEGKHPEEAIAFVVGHEVTHVFQKHGKRQQKKSITAMILGAAAAAALGARGNAISDWGSLAGNVVGSHFSRKDEYRADEGGLRGMHRAGYRMDGAIELLQILEKEGGNQNRTINGWLGSHPITRNRLARVRELMSEIESGRSAPEPSEKELERDDKGTPRS
jgi:predicted Zn-dependent protease